MDFEHHWYSDCPRLLVSDLLDVYHFHKNTRGNLPDSTDLLATSNGHKKL